MSLDGGATTLPHAENADELQVYTFALAATWTGCTLAGPTNRAGTGTTDSQGATRV